MILHSEADSNGHPAGIIYGVYPSRFALQFATTQQGEIC
jgi:hypothetical protein